MATKRKARKTNARVELSDDQKLEKLWAKFKKDLNGVCLDRGILARMIAELQEVRGVGYVTTVQPN